MHNPAHDSAFLQQIVEASYDGIVVIHLDGTIVLVNSAAARITGMPAREMIGGNLFDFTAPGGGSAEQRQEWIDHIRAHRRFSFETRFQRPDGRTVYIEQGITSVSDASAEEPLVIAIIRDITDKKEAEQRLTGANTFLQAVIEGSHDAIIVGDMRNVCLLANSAAERLTGYSRQELVGRRFFAVVAVSALSPVSRRRHLHALRATGHLFLTTALTNRAGDLIDVECSVSLIPARTDSAPMLVYIVRDISERKRVEAALQEATRFRKQFFTNITHEFRTPLTLAMAPLEDLLRGAFGRLGKAAREQVAVALGGTQRLYGLVTQLLDIAMTDAAGQPPVYALRDLRSFVGAILDTYVEFARSRQIELAFRPADNLSAMRIDVAKTEKIVRDLLAIVCKQTAEGGRIDVILTDAAGGMRLRVTNTDDPLPHDPASAPDALPDAPDIEVSLFHAKELVGVLGGQLHVHRGSRQTIALQVWIPDPPPTVEMPADPAPEETARAQVVLADLERCSGICEQHIDGDRPLILIVEDNPAVRKYVSTLVRKKYDFIEACNGREALQVLERHMPDLVLCDVMMPEMDGYALLRRIRNDERLRSLAFIFLTARADTAMKVEGLESGADDYIVKPFNSLELLARIESLLRLRTLMLKSAAQENTIATLTRKLQEKYYYGRIIGKSAAMRTIFQLLETVRESEAPVLITGETGTGKELIANAVHYNSRRKDGPMVSVNCSAIPRELMESECFGHAKGAFTGATQSKKGYFEEASGGTLFLDEIGEMDKEMQAKLLRALEQSEVTRVGDAAPTPIDIRLIAATNKNLLDEVRAGTFRQDLFYRLHVIPVHVPALRKRPEDIPLLVEHFLRKAAERMGREPPPLTEQDLQVFMAHPYPGNVRELENSIERFCLLGSSAQALQGAAPGPFAQPAAIAADDDIMTHAHPLKAACARTEKELIVRILAASGQDYPQTARALNIGLSSLYRKIKEYGIGR